MRETRARNSVVITTPRAKGIREGRHHQNLKEEWEFRRGCLENISFLSRNVASGTWTQGEETRKRNTLTSLPCKESYWLKQAIYQRTSRSPWCNSYRSVSWDGEDGGERMENESRDIPGTSSNWQTPHTFVLWLHNVGCWLWSKGRSRDFLCKSSISEVVSITDSVLLRSWQWYS